ncbi:hypothetical protein HHI36_022930 [Cryptolaemus montrouzieri]|uniref:Uncharacterized protein n=1 Tax=Cryptolaemus montrouzieri TaxID=559131 RepID=A0ABD2PEV3_9CUCU
MLNGIAEGPRIVRGLQETEDPAVMVESCTIYENKRVRIMDTFGIRISGFPIKKHKNEVSTLSDTRDTRVGPSSNGKAQNRPSFYWDKETKSTREVFEFSE